MLKASKSSGVRGFDRRSGNFLARPLALEPALWSGDRFSIWTSWALIFTMLVYVYPLKLSSADVLRLSNGALGLAAHGGNDCQKAGLFAVYAIGFSALVIEILLLNWHAWRRPHLWQLDERSDA